MNRLNSQRLTNSLVTSHCKKFLRTILAIKELFMNVCVAICQLYVNDFVRTSVKMCESVQLNH